MNLRTIILSILTLFLLFLTENAQTNTDEPYIVQSHSSACEINAASFDNLIQRMKESNERVFVIAHLGKGETSRNLNHRRLYNVRVYFKYRHVDLKRIVFAESESIKTDEGRIELYLGSKLTLISLVSRKGDICVDCCGPNEQYYPDRDELERRQKRKRSRN